MCILSSVEEIDDPMSDLERIKNARHDLIRQLQELEAQEEQLASKMQLLKRDIIEHDAAIRVLSKVCGKPEPEETPPVSQLSGKEAMFEIIQQFPDVGLKASSIRQKAQERFAISIAPASGSNYLWRLHQEAKIQREGHKWYLAPTNVSGGSNVTADKTQVADVTSEAPAATGASKEGG